MNKDISSNSLEYHENTKHSEISVMNSPHYLDWDNRPYPFKIYTDLDSISLPSDFSPPSMNAILAINKSNFQYKHQDKDKDKSKKETDDTSWNTKNKTKLFTLKDLAIILFFSAGITRETKYDENNIFYMRAASATGALYPIEVYVVCKDIHPNLKAGVYHFSPAQFNLTKIRSGDYSSLLASIVSSTDDSQVILNSDLIIILTSYAWRNAWKYQDRSYRHWFWDSGVIAANLLSIIFSMENKTLAKIHLGFIDDKVNQLLELEKDKEAAVAIISLNVKHVLNSNKKINNITTEKLVDTPLPRTIPLSKREQKFPLIWKTHNRSKLFTIEEVKEWTKAGITQINNLMSSNKTIIKKQYITNEYQQQQLSSIPSIGETILKRGSTRKFSRDSITLSNLSSILYNSTREISMDYKKDKESLINIYLILNDVKGIDPGGYFYNRFDNSLDLIKDKVSRKFSAYLCLGQSLFGDASAVLFLMANLSETNKILGNRGYRAAQFEAGVIAGNIYLLAYAHAIGASGSTFYDDAVTEFFSPHAENKNTMIAVGIGNPAYKSRAGKILPVKFSKEQLLEKTKHISG